MVEENRKIYYREDLEYTRSRLTIERQLQMYERHPDGNERAATLWHAWHQNKRWLIRLLELTLASFPSYSRHDASHADAVLHNIERVMGESRIAQLSATDCFAILHTVYIHDIGMAILAEDRERIVRSDEFVEMIDELADGADKDLKKAAALLKKNFYYQKADEEIGFESLAYHNARKRLYKAKLETYYAVVQLLAEYQRRRHGEKAASGVKDWILDQDKLRSEFSMSGVPIRIFLRIADCASLHTDWEFQHILELPPEENGYDNDMLHPRFVAVLLQLGDALDIDNDRFHPFAHAFSGSFPVQSQAHYDKHLAIRTLKITPEEIIVEADCETREAMRLIRNECDGIESLLKSASYYWTSIAPKGFSGALPSFRLSRLLLNGKEIPWDLALSRFQISQQKAFSLLQGENIYSGSFPFVRELLQNAIDSTKLQCYEDYRTSSRFRFGESPENFSKAGITNISQIINPVEYPIEISIWCCRLKENEEWEEITLSDIPEKESEKEKYGILFTIKDYGTGINKESLQNISNVGTIYNNRKKLLREMPDWLRPTGEFGIGLQSVFLVNDNFFCDTYVRNGERYRIEFLIGANGKNGYINVEPVDAIEKPMAYGTEFQVFIDHEKKKPRIECQDAWTGYDPFADSYEDSRIRRDITALTIQILLDIDRQLEDLLFPVYVSVKFDLGKEQRELLKSKLSKIAFSNLEEESYTKENLRKHMCWIYQDNDTIDGSSRFEIEGGVCRTDLTQMKIYLWLDDLAVNACIGVDYIAKDDFHPIQSPCKLYYKGILVGTHYINKSGNLLEYINIQGGRNGRKLIQLSRNGLTQEGILYIEEVLIPRIYKNLFDVLKSHANQKFVSLSGTKVLTLSEKIMENIRKSLEGRKNAPGNMWHKQLVGTSLYYNFYMQELEKEKSLYVSSREEEEKAQWRETIENVSEAVREKINNVSGFHSQLATIEVHADLEENDFTVLDKKEITIADFYNRENKFAVISKRREKGDKWISNLIWLKGSDQEDTKMPMLTDELEKATGERIMWSDWANRLESWANFMLDNVGSILETQSIRQSNFVQALLQSVSISACFTDASGNLKIHILSGQPVESVFYNVHAKYRLLKKMEKRKQKANAIRFAGNVWMGYELLQIPAIQEDVYSIKEQYIQESETFLIFPCSGEGVQKLIQLAEYSEEGDWFDGLPMGEESGEIDSYLKTVKDLLVEAAETLYSGIVIKYEHAYETSENFFVNEYVNYCMQEKVRMSEIAFWDLLNSGYTLMLGGIFRQNLRKKEKEKERDSWKTHSVENLSTKKLESLIQERLPKREDVEVLNGVIILEILDNVEAIIGGGELVENSDSRLVDDMKQLTEYCLQWEWLWNLVEHLQMEQIIQEIKRELKIKSQENENLIISISEQVNSEQYKVSECYERMWDELIGAAIEQRKKRFTEKQHFKLLDWMGKKEESME